MSQVISQTLKEKHGTEVLHDPAINESTALGEAERASLGLTGLLPVGTVNEVGVRLAAAWLGRHISSGTSPDNECKP